MIEDPRQRRTRELLGAALARLLQNAPLDDISVAALCREAGVHRTTFYAHADSVHDFALAEFSRSIDRLSEVTVEPGESSPAHVAARYSASLRQVLQHVVDDRDAYRALFGSSTRGVFRGVLDARLRERARLAIEVWVREGVAGAPREESAVTEAGAFIAGALTGAIEVWAHSDDEDADAAAARLSRLMPRWWPDPA
ncbi:TetR/AcrR family transcriptional regulator [Microbacterium sp.]|uniref:TetR/AcrR family transcriptional regulator n=1 Tax=Microbacterium sp. TaxID=51671 RepID=UPI002604209C|nr:TetR/AcrR family transcriptional regulator [Microbacterium sp.]